MDGKIYLDIIEVAEILRLSPHTIRNLIKKGTLLGLKLTNKYYVHDLEVKRFLEETKITMVKNNNNVFSEEDSMNLLSCDRDLQ